MNIVVTEWRVIQGTPVLASGARPEIGRIDKHRAPLGCPTPP
jgi:hypothetical protein